MSDDTPMTVPAREGSASFKYQHWEVGDSRAGCRIATVVWYSETFGFGSRSHDECVANFRLILSAPELLSACLAALELLENPDADGFSADKVEQTLRSAIAKAKGQA
jgi:hypothetical protein